MLIPRRLDDQTYADIVEEAEARLPWLCPVWTDHNAHDPGITLLELMAWYKELQQYQLDQLTPAIRRKLLELAGLHLGRERPAVCVVSVPEDGPGRLEGARLTGPQGLPFELMEPVPARRPRLVRVLAERAGERVDITSVCAGGPPFQPFAFGGAKDSGLLLGFDRPPEGTLRLWFQVERPRGAARNLPHGETPPPRTLVWELVGAGPAEPLEDETWALSWSGFVTLPVPENWPAGEEHLWWVRLRQTEGGCEESVRLSGLWAGRFRVVQQESRARQYAFTIGAWAGQRVLAASAQALRAQLAVFLRTPAGWEQTDRYQSVSGPDGLELTVDGTGAAPAVLPVSSQQTVMTCNMLQATIMDNKLPTFGMCSSLANPTVASATASAMGALTPMPCMPVTPAPWVPGAATVLVGGKPLLNNSSKLMCAYGGVIQVNMTPALTVQTP